MTTLRRHRGRTALAGLGLVAALTAAGCGSPDTTSESPGPDRDRAIVDAMNAVVRGGFPGVQVVITGPDGPRTLTAGAGDLATGAPIPDHARVRIGSNTKTFVATVVLQLAAEGRLDLDAPIERYLPGVVHGTGNDGDKISVRQLLQHTSGLPDYLAGGNPEIRAAANTPQLEVLRDDVRWRQYRPADLISLAMTMPPQFAPGARSVYTNTNYLLLGMLIEKITGRPAAAEIGTRIIDKLGLPDTYFPAPGETVIRGPHPKGYQVIDGKQVDFTDLNPSWGDSAGAMVATGADLDRFFTALLNGELLPAAQLEQMKQTVPFDRMPGAGYGLGLIHLPVSCGKDVWGHGGSIPGFGTQGGVTAAGIAVNIAVNQLATSDATADLVDKLLDTALCES
ncbi:serine hydrolase [Nocardia sp. SYP-A9097]|uniref:serine hydrolase domain-containing protein n=1 Tax=Nocardia sp. SYP-A9097 TaxID=2663237 RepID=UPI00129BCCC5|nr:serine hydrolase domain-containing protein [Nocardia sp. SYP-A9097]MRH86097.1 serine hydrolase [Nocardia sp. SYP-A9097]